MPSSTVVNVRLPAELVEATRARAEQEDRSASAVIRRALKAHLAEPLGDGQPVAAKHEATEARNKTGGRPSVRAAAS